jgi:5-methylcytosine-specific restriction protein A
MFKEEGGSRRVEHNFHERSRINRALCLDYFGFTCLGCGLIMNHKYGPIGENVIEVHHLIPVSAMGESKIVNPIKDLVPLCPNCHTIVHRTNPPSSLEQLQKWTQYNPIEKSKHLHNGNG